MRIAIAQIAPLLGNLEANLALHLDAGRKAARAGADLILFPELSLTGYRLQDLVPDVARPIEDGGVLKPLFALSRRIALAFGMVEESEGHRYYNSAVFLEGGRVRHVHRKVYLPTYGLFEEGRYLAPGDTFAAFRSRAGRVGMLVCEDLWHPASALVLAQDGADVVLVLSNGPAHAGDGTGGPRHHEIWRDLVRVTAQMQTVYVVMANRVGCEDGVSFFGGSMAVDPLGRVRAEARLHGEDRVFADLDRATLRRARTFYPLLRDERLSVLQREIGRLAATPLAERGAGGS
jgi:predicted amidohydrolase